MSVRYTYSVAPGVDWEDVWLPLQAQFLKAVDAFYALTRKRIVVTSGWRSPEYQAQLYAGRATNKNRFGEKLPVAKPGDSSHNFGLGIDSDIEGEATPAERKLWTTIRKTYNLSVPANDWNHCEVYNWRAVAKALMAA